MTERICPGTGGGCRPLGDWMITDESGMFEVLDANGVSYGTYATAREALVVLLALVSEECYVTLLGTYNLAVALTINLGYPLHFRGDKETTIVLNALPSLIISSIVTFENITILSTLDGGNHIDLDASVDFKWCNFDLQLDSGAGGAAVFEANPAGKATVRFIDCTFTVGTDAAVWFVLLDYTADMELITFVRCRIVDALSESTIGNGSVRFVISSNNSIADLLSCYDMVVHNVEGGSNNDSGLFYATSKIATTCIIDGHLFEGGTFNDANNHQWVPCAPVADYHFLSNIFCMYRTHLFGGNIHTNWSNSALIGDATTTSSMDLQVAGSDPKFAEISNIYLFSAEIDVNSGFSQVNISNVQFRSSRLWLGDESATGIEMRVNLSNCTWKREATGAWITSAVQFQALNSTLNLPELKFTNCEWRDYRIVIAANVTPANAIRVVFRGCTVQPSIDAAFPTLFSGGARDADDQEVWASDCLFHTDVPPFDTWNNIRVNDRLVNVRFWDLDGAAWEYSEMSGTGRILNVTAFIVVAHGLVADPSTFGTVQITGTGNHIEVTQLEPDTIGAVNFTCRFVGGGNVTADRDFFWRAHVTRQV